MSEWDPFRMMREMMRWDPFREMSGWLPRMFGRGELVPTCEVRENGSSLRIVADMPGVQRDDVEIQLSGNRIAITGKREAEDRSSDEQYHTYERSYGAFTRSFTLPDYVDTEHVSCDLRDGVLTIVLPKKPGQQGRKIAIGGPATKA